MSEPVYLTAGATFDADRRYRYRLWRIWDSRPRVAFIMLNPSTADETVLDPTLRRCLGFAQSWGCGGFEVGNLFALRSTQPRALYSADDPVGPANDYHLAQIAEAAKFVVVGWGAHGHAFPARVSAVIQILAGRVNVARLGRLTAGGQPRHPLYLRADLQPEPWSRASPGGAR
jgi:hypothetical protein